MPNQMVSNFGGLSFANNKLDFADPAYDTINAATADMANTWATNKAAYEKVADFITGQSVLDKDVQLKQGTANKFTEGIKLYIDRGDYEHASRELDKSIRDFNNNKGFQMAVGNYAAFTQFAQKQRDYVGYDEDTKNRYIAAIHSQYQGVKVHEDGSVSGTFQGRDMGEYVDIQKELAAALDDFRETKTAELTSKRLGTAGQTLDTSKLTKDFIDESAFMAHTKFLIETNPNFKHFFDTMAIVDSTKSGREIAQNVDRRAYGSIGNAQNMNATYKALQKAATTEKGKAELAKFENKYKDKNGNLRPDLYTLDVMLTDRGLFSKDDERSVEAKREFINNAFTAKENYIRQGLDPNEAIERYQRFVKANIEPEATDALIAFADKAEATLRDVNNTLFKEEHAYQAFLPKSGVKSDWVHYSTYTDDYYTKLLADRAKNKNVNALVVESTSRPSEFSFLFDGTENGKYDGKGVALYEGKLNEFKQAFVNHGIELAEKIKGINAKIKEYKLSGKPGADKLEFIGDPPRDIEAADADKFGKLNEATLNFLKDNYYNEFESYNKNYRAYRSEYNRYNNANNLLLQAQEHAIERDPVLNKKVKELQQEYDSLENSKEFASNDNLLFRKAKLLRELGEVKGKQDSVIHEYLAAHANAGFSVGEFNVLGIRNGDSPYAKDVNDMSVAIEEQMMIGLMDKSNLYNAFTKNSKFINNTGTHLDGTLLDNNDIKNIKLIAITTNGLTENPVYKFAIQDPKDKGNVSSTIGIIEYEDVNDNFAQYRHTISQPVFDGEVGTDAKTIKFLNELDDISASKQSINIRKVTSDLLNTGISQLEFDFKGTENVIGGIVTKEYADFSTQDNINVDKETFKIKYKYKDVSEKEHEMLFDNMAQLRRFAIDQYNEIYDNMIKEELKNK